MSEKKATLDILGESHIPADLLTPTLGSNYGLDGYPDMEYGMGVLEGVLDQEGTEEAPYSRHASEKVGVDEEAEGMDLTALMEDSLADLAWLDPTQLQDPERLPETPVSIPELEEAWGVHRRTNGVQVVARDLDRARYEESLESPTAKKQATARSLMKIVRRAMQRSAAGHDLNDLMQEAILHLGDQVKRASAPLLLVRGEHGLAGNVFIRAAAYPGYAQGKWKSLRQTGARYVVVSPDQMRKATWIQDGRCIYTKKIAVTEVPWEEAYRYYAPRLETAKGIKVASKADPREALRAAFLHVPEAKQADSTYRPKHDPSQREGFLAEGGQEQKVYTQQERRVANGVRKIMGAISKGAYGDQLKALIRKTFRDEDHRLAAKALTPILTKTGALEQKPVERASYQGPEFTAHSMTRLASLGDENANVMSRTARGAMRWIRRAMSEGFAGKELTTLIDKRFANEVLAEIEEPLKVARKAHEGGAGFLYVDAEAYASPRGVKGCEEGALKHRANQIPAVAQMGRCASCAMVRDLQDGTRKCAVYNKALLDDTTGPDIERVKKANIRVANMNDAEQTAAFFSAPENAFDPSEYGLRNANLEDVSPDLPENEKVAEITFGGWDL
jgi:hypothetical protein